MKYLVPFILAVVLVAAEGKVLPASDVENQHTNTQEPSTDPLKQVQDLFNNWGTQMQQHLPNQDEFLNTLKEHSTGLVNNMNDFIKNVTEEYRRATSST
ncbi:Apolipophorin-III [Camponotus japonicus]